MWQCREQLHNCHEINKINSGLLHHSAEPVVDSSIACSKVSCVSHIPVRALEVTWFTSMIGNIKVIGVKYVTYIIHDIVMHINFLTVVDVTNPIIGLVASHISSFRLLLSNKAKHTSRLLSALLCFRLSK